MATSKWTDELLDRMRHQGDPLADRAAKLLWENRNSKEILEELRIISRNHNVNNLKNVKPLLDYFQETEHVKVSAEEIEAFRVSAKLFNNYGFRFCGLLFFKALPTGYMCPKPGHVLESTKLLVNYAARRVMETAQFVFAVNNANWYQSGNPGLESIQRVRLMHAGMRMALLNDSRPDKKWNMELGVPINQEDLCLTNHLFSLAMIDGLDQMGVHLNQDERNAIFITWQRIGQSMGICPELYASTMEDGMDQFHTILKRQSSAENPDGPVLTKALLESMNELLRTNISLEKLEDLTTYFLNDKRSWKSLGMHKPTIFDRIFDAIVHFLTSLKIWQRIFNHNNSSIKGGWFTRIINYFLAKRFNLQEHLSRYPKTNLLESITKIILVELSKKDLQNPNQPGSGDLDTLIPGKKFFMSDELYKEWDLGSYEMDVNPKDL